jgi:hypothetical protein
VQVLPKFAQQADAAQKDAYTRLVSRKVGRYLSRVSWFAYSQSPSGRPSMTALELCLCMHSLPCSTAEERANVLRAMANIVRLPPFNKEVMAALIQQLLVYGEHDTMRQLRDLGPFDLLTIRPMTQLTSHR